MSSVWWAAPYHESDRIWSEPEVIIYNHSRFPSDSLSISAYDVANRTWYELNIDEDVKLEYQWMESLIAKHIKEYHTAHGTLPDFNVINTNPKGSPVTFEEKAVETVSRQIKGNVHYGRAPSDILPTTTFGEVKQKRLLACSSDRCTWDGIECVFKRIEFVEDIDVIEREIRSRENLIRSRGQDKADPNLTREFNVLPIIAVVQKSHDTDEVLGILLPFGGETLENLAGGPRHGMSANQIGDEEGEGSFDGQTMTQNEDSLSSSPEIPVSEAQVRKLIRSVHSMTESGVTHGDIIDRNTLLTPDKELMLIDLGGAVRDYKSDAHALGSMVLWILDRVIWDDTSRVEELKGIGRRLMEAEDFDSIKAEEI